MERKRKTHHLASRPVYAPFIDIPGEDLVLLFGTMVIFLPILFFMALFFRLKGLLWGFLVVGLIILTAALFLRREFRKRPRKGVLLEALFYFFSNEKYPARRL
jgi:ABC-type iron transport system FetAB permease component